MKGSYHKTVKINEKLIKISLENAALQSRLCPC